jgi:hypothetical protein
MGKLCLQGLRLNGYKHKRLVQATLQKDTLSTKNPNFHYLTLAVSLNFKAGSSVFEKY